LQVISQHKRQTQKNCKQEGVSKNEMPFLLACVAEDFQFKVQLLDTRAFLSIEGFYFRK